MSLYTHDARNILHSLDLPTNLIVDVVEYTEYLAVRLYRDNFELFDGVDKEHIAKTIGKGIKQVRDTGIPCYLEVDKNVPH